MAAAIGVDGEQAVMGGEKQRGAAGSREGDTVEVGVLRQVLERLGRRRGGVGHRSRDSNGEDRLTKR